MRRIVPALSFALVFLALVFCANPVLAASTAAAPVGVVMVSQGAQVSQVTAQNGTSLYAGDTLNTDADGSLRVRFGTSQLMLGPATVVKVAENKNGVALVLQHGIVRFSAAGSPMELRALAAIVHPGEDASGQLSIVGPSEFQIGSTKGNLNVDIDGVDKVVSEATAYDVTLEADACGSADCWRWQSTRAVDSYLADRFADCARPVCRTLEQQPFLKLKLRNQSLTRICGRDAKAFRPFFLWFSANHPATSAARQILPSARESKLTMSSTTSASTWPGVLYSCGVDGPEPAMKK